MLQLCVSILCSFFINRGIGSTGLITSWICFCIFNYIIVFLGSVRSGSSSLNLELEPELEPAHLAVFRTRTYNTWTRTEPELYLWVRFEFSSKFMNKFGFNHVICQILHALKLLNKKFFFLISIRKTCFFLICEL